MHTRAWFPTTAIVITVITSGACQWRSSSDEVADAIRQQLAAPASQSDRAVSADVQNLYAQHPTALWVVGSRVDPDAALEVIRSARDHGLEPADYSEQAIAARLEKPDSDSGTRAEQMASLDIMVSRALLELGHDVAVGRILPEDVHSGWKSSREQPDLAASLVETVSGGDIKGWLNSIRPQQPGYAALQAELKRLRDAPSTIETVPAGKEAGSDLSVAERSKLIAINLERWRWLPDDLGATHIFVNIPAYRMAVHQGEQTPLTMKVVVGEPDKATPVFSSEVTTVVFSPYWNIPESIIDGEIAAAVARDPSYLKRNNIDILRVTKNGTEDVNPERVNWDDEDELKSLSFRQRPGDHNALGHVKFLFPNKHSVYLHDTPADAAFTRNVRALSHGCVRLEKPEELASFVLQSDATWDQPRIREAMYSGTEKQVALKTRIPVHLAYMTAWMDESGAVQFSRDVYGYDEAQAKLDRKAAR